MNPQTPDRPHPADLQRDCTVERRLGFTSSKEVNLYCYVTGRMLKGSGEGWSYTSQEDADAMAVENARNDVNSKVNHLASPIGGSTIG